MTTNLDQIGPNPCPHCGGVYGDHNETCDFTVDSLNRSSELTLTPTQRQQCLLSLLDDVIKKDEERTVGEWKTKLCNCGFERCEVTAVGPGIFFQGNGFKPVDASFIASASVSFGLTAQGLKETISNYAYDLEVTPKDSYRYTLADKRLNSILSIYPDEILRRYLKI